ncbi:MAG: prefoldin subunit alpha [Candidatus Marsarchaeota archaeon]|nr:prefoldin subunit alpha [Candidatus Marsarchaeota archaeon]
MAENEYISSAKSIDELRYLQQLYQNQYMSIAQEVSNRLDVLKDFGNSQVALEHMDTMGGKQTLMHIGGGAYLSSKINESGKIIMNVGAGYLVEKNVPDAKAYIAKILDKETQYINRLNKNKKEIENALIEISYRVEELSR